MYILDTLLNRLCEMLLGHCSVSIGTSTSLTLTCCTYD